MVAGEIERGYERELESIARAVRAGRGRDRINAKTKRREGKRRLE